MSQPLSRLASYLAGDFHNQAQAWENPPLFAQIQVCYAPLSGDLFETYGFYVEQAYVGHLEDPYRTAVIALNVDERGLVIRNYRPLDPGRWQGLPRQNWQALREMKPEDLSSLPGCDVVLTEQDGVFVGETEPGSRCRVVRDGKPSYLHTRVQIGPQQFLSHDRGLDPETHQQVWGALAGSFVFDKQVDWSGRLPNLA